MKRIAVIGSAFTGGALQIIDAISGNSELQVVALFDSDASLKGKKLLDVEVLDSSANILPYFNQGFFDSAVIGIGGDLNERERIYQLLIKSEIPLINIIDETSQIRTGAKIGVGNVILGSSYIGPNVTIGDNCYILNNVSIQHDSNIGAHCYLATGTLIGAYVNVGKRVRFEMGSGAKSRIRVGDGSVIPTGSILMNDNINK